MRRVAGGRVERDEPQKRNARPSLSVERYECNTGPVVRPRRRSRLETEVRKPDIGRVSHRATRPSERDVVALLLLVALLALPSGGSGTRSTGHSATIPARSLRHSCDASTGRAEAESPP